MGYSSVPIQACIPAAAWEFAQKSCANRVVRFSTDLNSDHRALQGHKCSAIVDVLAAARDTFLRTLFRAQGPIDIFKLLGSPNAQFKEIIRPVPQLSAQLQLSPQLSVGGYYQFRWEADRLPPAGPAPCL